MIDKMWKVYAHINKINGKIYIGITSRDPHKRWKNGRGYSYNRHFYSAIKKYGWESFDHVVFDVQMNLQEACQMGKWLISQFNLTNENYGYNNDEGGGLPPILAGQKNPFYNVRPQAAITASVVSRTGKCLSQQHKK